MQRTFLTLAICGAISACSSTPPKTAEAPPPARTAAATPPAPQAAPAPVKPQVAVETEAQKLDRIIKTLAARSVYFDYDNFSIKPQYQDTLKQDADLLRSAPPLSIRVVGNADERGSAEYNLALGQKRAEAVRHALAAFGIADSRMEVISYGKEKPRATCHEESCWSQNRRVDFANSK